MGRNRSRNHRVARQRFNFLSHADDTMSLVGRGFECGINYLNKFLSDLTTRTAIVEMDEIEKKDASEFLDKLIQATVWVMRAFGP
jgi:hypothetical protein